MENKKTIIAIGDIHGLTTWKQVVAENPGCKYVFLGDYLDPYIDIAPDLLITNLKEIIQLKKEQPDNVILLLGNHDVPYFIHEAIPCKRYNMFIAGNIKQLFVENQHLFQYAFQEGNIIFTHAGIAHQWFIHDFKGDRHKNIAEQLNNPTPEQTPALYQCGGGRGGDKNTIGGILWANYTELDPPLQGYIQIVGHNQVQEIQEIPVNDVSVWFCDCLWKGEYLVIDNRQFEVKRVSL
ncbi:MAG: metallophosphoesterase [Candidatus Symbiothrix sp.]|jgi:hypothetical protein|nr:metallophosphoesterase [Candidatus Symbiothrix sp.]